MEDHFADLVASQPGNEGKRFATAKDAGFFELTIELANRSPSDPHTLIRAARIFGGARPKFALAVGIDSVVQRRQWMGLLCYLYRRPGRIRGRDGGGRHCRRG